MRMSTLLESTTFQGCRRRKIGIRRRPYISRLLETVRKPPPPIPAFPFLFFKKIIIVIIIVSRLVSTCHDAESKFLKILSRNETRNFLLPEDFICLIQDVVDTHPGLIFLKEANEFHSRYIHTVGSSGSGGSTGGGGSSGIRTR